MVASLLCYSVEPSVCSVSPGVTKDLIGHSDLAKKEVAVPFWTATLPVIWKLQRGVGRFEITRVGPIWLMGANRFVRAHQSILI